MHKPPHWQKWLASHASDWLCHPCTDKLAEAQDPPTAGMADQYFASVGRGQKLGRAAQVRAGRAGRARGSPAGHGDGAREGGVLSVVDMTEEAGSPEGSPPRSAAGRGGPATRSGAAKPTKPSQARWGGVGCALYGVVCMAVVFVLSPPSRRRGVGGGVGCVVVVLV